MVGHQDIGVDGAAELAGKPIEMEKVELIVFFSEETDGAVIAALDDVPGDAGDGEAGAAGHGGSFFAVRPPIISENRGLSPIIRTGKAKKMALVACMRKLLVIINTMLKNDTLWNPQVASTGV
jgi:transposase